MEGMIIMDIVKKWTESSLIIKILIGVIIGGCLGFFVPNFSIIGFFGDIFVSALKAIAPILVFVLVGICCRKRQFIWRWRSLFWLIFFMRK